MAKTKFNYTKRKSDGVKLAQIVAKDLRKAAESFFAKAKNSQETSPLQLELPGKRIGDEGLREISLALQEALRAERGLQWTRIGELNLAGNNITTSGLKNLVPVIADAFTDLEDLDLSNNLITIASPDDATAWEDFLRSFRNCRVMRRINLSDNRIGVSLPWEIFARVYAAESPVEPDELSVQAVLGFPDSHDVESLGSNSTPSQSRARGRQSSIASLRPWKPTLSQSQIIKRRAGLRSVPYILLRNVNLTDSGSLWLSYIIAHHFFPEQLMTDVKAGAIATHLEEYAQNSRCKGIIYSGNEKLTASGIRLLEFAEMARNSLLAIEMSEDASIEDQIPDLKAPRKTSRSPHKRRSSGSNSQQHSPNSSESELESARKKVQRTIIEDRGVHTSQIWSTALKMLVVARAFLSTTIPRPDILLASTVTGSPFPLSRQSRSLSSGSTNHRTKATSNTPRQESGSEDGGGPVVDQAVAKKPSKSMIFKFSRPSIRKQPASIIDSPCPTSAEKLADEIPKINIREQVRERALRYQEMLAIGRRSSYGVARDPATHAPEIWQGILGYAVDAKGVLSGEQCMNVLQWAWDGRTLAQEIEARGKPDSVQIWKILQGMGCLAYEINT